MRFGAMNFPIRSILAEIDNVGRLGFDYLELAMDAPEAHYAVIQHNFRSIKQALLNNNLDLVCHLPTFLYTADLTASIRQASLLEMAKSLETAAELGALKVVVHPSYIGGMSALVPEISMAYARDALGSIVEKSASLGLRLCLENMFYTQFPHFTEPEDLAPFFKQFGTLELTLDTAHSHIKSNNRNRTLAFIEQYRERLGHVHISDNAGDRDAHLPVGKGTTPFQKIMTALNATGYDDTLTLEIFTPDSGDLVQSRERISGMLAVASSGI